MTEITIGTEVFNVDSFNCYPVLVEVGDRVQTLDGADHVGGIKIKRYLSASFDDISKADMARLQAVCLVMPQTITYPDSKSGTIETRTFMLQYGIPAPMKFWRNNRQYYNRTTIEFKEKGASAL